jgi:hypothetical protein
VACVPRPSSWLVAGADLRLERRCHMRRGGYLLACTTIRLSNEYHGSHLRMPFCPLSRFVAHQPAHSPTRKRAIITPYKCSPSGHPYCPPQRFDMVLHGPRSFLLVPLSHGSHAYGHHPRSVLANRVQACLSLRSSTRAPSVIRPPLLSPSGLQLLWSRAG